MPVPAFQEMFLPFLEFLSDGEPHKIPDIAVKMAERFQLSVEDREELIPSGQSTKLGNRVGWARTHLKFAGLIEKVNWGEYRITAEGSALLKSAPAKIDLKFLDTIPAHYVWFHTKKTPTTPSVSAVAPSRPAQAELTPQEELGALVADLKSKLVSELKASLEQCDPFRFEQIVVDLLLAMGYGGSRAEAGSVTKRTGDEGIDGTISEDRLGLDTIYLQAKRWANTVGRKEIQSFVGALAGKQAHKGIFITTSDYTQEALNYAKSVPQKIILIDGDRLSELMIDHNVGVSVVETHLVKRLDGDYFAEM